MSKINWSRVILGGIVAGIIIAAAKALVDGVILPARSAGAMKALG
jgi:hypothetical protein